MQPLAKQPLANTLGSMVINSSNLEFLLSCLVARLMSDDKKIGAIITSEMSFQNKLTAFANLTKYKVADPERLKLLRLDELVKRVSDAEEHRNQALHSVYLLEENQTDMARLKVTAKRKSGLRFQTEKIGPGSLKQILNEQVNLIKELESLFVKLYPGENISYG